MPTDKRKRAIRARMAATGEPYSEAARHVDQAHGGDGDVHQHPAPDLSVLDGLTLSAGRPVDLPLAAAVVGACRAGCGPCQDTLIPQLLAVEDRATIAVLAGAVYGLVGAPGVFASPTTRAWQPLARAAHESGDNTAALAALDQMTDQAVAELLDDALDHWAAGGADITPILLDLGEADEEPGADVRED